MSEVKLEKEKEKERNKQIKQRIEYLKAEKINLQNTIHAKERKIKNIEEVDRINDSMLKVSEYQRDALRLFANKVSTNRSNLLRDLLKINTAPIAGIVALYAAMVDRINANLLILVVVLILMGILLILISLHKIDRYYIDELFDIEATFINNAHLVFSKKETEEHQIIELTNSELGWFFSNSSYFIFSLFLIAVIIVFLSFTQ